MSSPPHTTLFTEVDRTSDPDFFVRFMDEAQKPAGIQMSKRLMLEHLNVAPGETILEAGCGPGTDLFDLGERVGSTGHLVGLDASGVMLAEARRRTSVLGLPIEFARGDVQALPFEDGSFDACRAARLLEHLPDAEPALAELVRVTRHHGRIVVFDFDWDTLLIDHPDKQTTRTIVLSYADSIRNGGIGRQLPRLFKEQHLAVRSFDPLQVFVHYSLAELFLGSHLTRLQANGILSPGSARVWWEYLRQANDRGTLMISFTAFVIVGDKN